MKGGVRVQRYTLTVPDNLPDMTLDKYLAHALPLLPERARRAAFAARDVKMNGQRTPRDTRALPGAQIAVFTPYEMQIPIVYEDEHLLILNKPAGLATDADRYSSMTVTDWAALHAQGAYQPRLCHRLDYQTSGLIALAKDDMAENALKEMFARRTGRKEYQCLVLGTPQPAQADCHAYLIKDPVRAVVHVSAKALPQAKPIETEYETIQAGATSRLRVILHTGRTHQIRAHLSFLGHPIIGDDLYGDRVANREYGKGRLMLCATRLLIDTQGAMPEIDGLDIRIDPPF